MLSLLTAEYVAVRQVASAIILFPYSSSKNVFYYFIYFIFNCVEDIFGKHTRRVRFLEKSMISASIIKLPIETLLPCGKRFVFEI